MKKLASLSLCLLLLFGLMAPALAADSQEARLQEVTLLVKNKLDIDTNVYTEFYGNLNEGLLQNTWSLSWATPEGLSLEVTATEDGTITRYSRYDLTTSDPYSGFYGPKLPKNDNAASKAAEAFLAQVLETGEKADFTSGGNYASDRTNSRFYGTVLLNDLPSPISFSMTVRLSDNAVTSFYRNGDENIIGGVPSPTPSATVGDAAGKLAGLTEFKLEYVLADGEAVLRYLPVYGDEYYVDAQTGAVVNLSELMRELSAGNANRLTTTNVEAAADASGGLAGSSKQALTEVELAGAAALADVMAAAALADKLLEEYPEFKLDAYTLSNTSYSTADKETGAVSAHLTFAREDDGGGFARAYVSMDAKTGALQELSSYRPYREEVKTKVSVSAAQKTAEQFLARIDPQAFAVSALYDSLEATEESYATDHSFTFAHKENGYFFLTNQASVSVDKETGAISRYSAGYDLTIPFDDAEGIVSEKEAQAGYYKAFDTVLGYIEVPQKLNPNEPEYAPMIAAGQTYLYALKLGYAAEQQEQYVVGVDAKTGEAVTERYDAEESLAYTDLSGHWAREQIEALAAQNIGLFGEEFLPSAALTQADMLALLLSANGGGIWDTADEEKLNALYREAYYMGVLSVSERNPSKVLTRAETVKLILDISGYGRVARLEGVFTTSFSDGAEIPAAYLGYASIAQALGLVSGDQNGAFAPNRNATRAEAAVILYQFMSK